MASSGWKRPSWAQVNSAFSGGEALARVPGSFWRKRADLSVIAERTPVTGDISGWRWSEGGVAAGPRHFLLNTASGDVERTVIVEAVERK